MMEMITRLALKDIAAVEAERDRYRAALEAVARLEFGNSPDYNLNADRWIYAAQKIVHDALSPPKE